MKKAPLTMAVYLVCNGSVASAVKERQHIIATSARSYMRRSFLFVTLEVQSLDLHRAWHFTLTKLRSRNYLIQTICLT